MAVQDLADLLVEIYLKQPRVCEIEARSEGEFHHEK